MGHVGQEDECERACEVIELLCMEVAGCSPAHPLDTHGGGQCLEQVRFDNIGQ